MSKIYLKGKGRKSALEQQMVEESEKIIAENNVDISTLDLPKTPDELRDFRNDLKAKYGEATPQPKQKEPSSTQDDLEPSTESSDVEFDQPEPVAQSEEPSTPVTRKFDLSEFEPVETSNPFFESFPEEDMHKATSDFPVFNEPEPVVETAQPSVPNDSVPDAWELMRQKREKTQAIGGLESAVDSVEAETIPASDTNKVPLADSTKKKATESMARQMAKITTFLTELGVKKVSKISEKHLDRLEEQGLIDRNFDVNGKTVTELLDDHNDLIDKMIEVDPQSKNDLIEAIKLVAEKHQIEMSPESNLAMVVVTIIISLAQAGLSQKREFKKTLKKISDTYTMQKRQIAPMEAEIQKLRDENARLNRNGVAPAQAPVIPMPFPEGNTESSEAPIRELSFRNQPPDNSGINVRRNSNEKVTEAKAMLDEIDSEVDEGTVVIKKGNKVAVKRGKVDNKK